MSTAAGGSAVVIAATAIRAAPEGFEPGYVLVLLEAEDGARRLARLDVEEPPAPGTTVAI
ncbi:MAG TPA: hypothetical protein VNB59_03720 [Solirubrobacterales bacterium]|nr:hypothetical protein [Solirubrobacterales bacterium]